MVLVFGCSHVEDDVSDARIVIGKSIEEISIGDARLRIVELLGEPASELVGDGSFSRLSYDDRGMEIYIVPATVGAPFLVTSVKVEAPYDGTTSTGIGIGSSRSEVMSVVGEPTESEAVSAGTLDIYRVGTSNSERHLKGNYDRAGEVTFWFGYRDDTLVRITMMGQS